MIGSNEIRKKSGCWSCTHKCLSNVEVNATIGCNHPDADVRGAFTGWESALTCKGYKMMPYTVETVEGEKNDK